MRCSIAALALAGAAVAMPSRIARDQVVNDVQVVEQVQWVTDVVTVVGTAPTPTPAPQQAPAPAAPAPAPAAPEVHAAPAAPVAHVQAAPAPPAPTTFVQVPAAAPTPAAPSPNSNSGSSDPNSSSALLDVVNKWRKLYNLSTLSWNDELASNAGKTGSDDNGTDEKHELNTISMAQVITPGINTCSGKASCSGLSSGFELAYLAGWLCEAPQQPLSALCKGYTTAAGMDLSSGETGHADILTSKAYKQIGCAFSGNGQSAASAQWTGLWICDLA